MRYGTVRCVGVRYGEPSLDSSSFGLLRSVSNRTMLELYADLVRLGPKVCAGGI